MIIHETRCDVCHEVIKPERTSLVLKGRNFRRNDKYLEGANDWEGRDLCSAECACKFITTQFNRRKPRKKK